MEGRNIDELARGRLWRSAGNNNINGYIAESFEDKDLNEFILKIFNDNQYADYVSKSAINSSKKYNWKDTSEKLNLLYQELKLL